MSARDETAVAVSRRPKPAKPTAVELFAGGGGLALGLHRAGFKPAFVVDSDERAYETLKANKRRYTRGWRLEREDVSALDYSTLGLENVDLVSAGAPCQPFSQGGHLRGEDDSRNMFPEVVRAVRELRPRTFVFENVRGLLFPSVRDYFNYIVAQLRVPSLVRRDGEEWRTHFQRLTAVPKNRHEYRVDWRILNAADFGLPQNRPRLVVVGTRIDETEEFVWPDATHSRALLLAALTGDDYWDAHDVPAPVRERVRALLPSARLSAVVGDRWMTARDLLCRLGPPIPNASDGDAAHVLVPGARLYSKHAGSPLDWPAKTVKAGVHGCPGGEHVVLLDDGSHRYFTVRECAALQGFPDDYALPALRTPAMRQLGNAVPVALAEAVGGALLKVVRHGETS